MIGLSLAITTNILASRGVNEHASIFRAKSRALQSKIPGTPELDDAVKAASEELFPGG